MRFTSAAMSQNFASPSPQLPYPPPLALKAGSPTSKVGRGGYVGPREDCGSQLHGLPRSTLSTSDVGMVDLFSPRADFRGRRPDLERRELGLKREDIGLQNTEYALNGFNRRIIV